MTRKELIHLAVMALHAAREQSTGAESHYSQCARYVEAAIDAMSNAGLAVVPLEPTNDMVQDCYDALELDGNRIRGTRDGLRSALALGDILYG
jgi:hypothetical protein